MHNIILTMQTTSIRESKVIEESTELAATEGTVVESDG